MENECDNYFLVDYFGRKITQQEFNKIHGPTASEKLKISKEERNKKWIRIRKKIELRDFTDEIKRGYYLRSVNEFNKKYVGESLIEGYKLCLYLIRENSNNIQNYETFNK